MLNAQTLKEFYEGETGKLVCQILREKIAKLIRISHGEKIAGYGFAYPYLPLFMGYNSCVELYPATMGYIGIEGIENILVEENSLPAHNDLYNKIICIHGAEVCNKLPNLISEFWRILAPNGELILITANQESFWRKSKTPFAYGTSYTKKQLTDIMISNKFFVRSATRALFFKQIGAKIFGNLLEKIGSKLWNNHGGVNIIIAQKLIYAPRGRKIRVMPSLIEKLFKPKPVTARNKA